MKKLLKKYRDQVNAVFTREKPGPDQNEAASSDGSLAQPHSRKKLFVAVGVVLAVVVVGGAAFALYTQLQKSKKADQAAGAKVQLTAGNGRFAEYKELDIKVTPSIPQLKLASDFSNVDDLSYFASLNDGSEQAKSILAKLKENQFAVAREGYHKEYYPMYEGNRYSLTPTFITTDSMLHNYHIMFDHSLRRLEETQLSAKLDTLSKSMLETSETQYEAVKGTAWENAAKRSVGLFAVGARLTDPTVKVPAYIEKEVNQELALIQEHKAAFKQSPLMNIGSNGSELEDLKEDYTQYVPRGHYDKSDQLKEYFRAMMWYGRITFRFKSADEVRSATLITLALQNDENKKLWDAIYQPINFFVGKSDDVTFYQVTELLQKTYGNDITLNTVTSNQQAFDKLVQSAEALDPPAINSIPIFDESIQPDREKEIKGFRFMGQRFTVDASIFQRLVERDVKNRKLPKGLDIPAAMGSEEALKILDDLGETKYPKYKENMKDMRDYLKGLSLEDRTQNLYWSWMHILQPLTDDSKPEGYPSFMRNQAWERKELNTYLGSWTELKHDTVLYAKQVYGEKGGGGPDPRDDRGYVEPNPAVYGRLASTIRMTITGLDSRGLLDKSMKQNYERLETLALSLKTISEKELNNQKLSDEEYELIRGYGGDLEHFWLEVNKDEPEFKKLGQDLFLDQNPAALVADVATDPNGYVLEEATGHINRIYVLFPIDGKLRIGVGGVYSYREFVVPQDERLTDKAWWKMLEDGSAPDVPAWTDMFSVSK